MASEYDDFFENDFVQRDRQAQARVIAALDVNPDDATRAIEISKLNGVPPAVVDGDLDHYDNQTKAAMSSHFVDNNEFIKGYINSHPLAAKVSNDDYAQLDTASQAIQAVPKQSVLDVLSKSVRTAVPFYGPLESMEKNVRAAWGDQPIGAWALQREQDWQMAKENPAAAAALMALGELIEVPVRGLSAVTTGFINTLGEHYTNVTGDPKGMERAEQFAQFIQDPGVWASIGVPMADLGHVATQHQIVSNVRETAQRIGMYARDGKEPPVGLSPVLDGVKQEQLDHDLEKLKAALKESAKSTTRERSPELYKQFVEQHGDQEMSISADGIRQLYGDKPPTADDPKLGWIPDLAQKAQAAIESGADVTFKLSDFLAHVDPGVAKELEDHIRTRPEGFTKDEAKEFGAGEGEVAPVEPASPVDVVRQTAGLEPSIDVFHATPHEFSAFSMDKIGTGEGSQSFGHGLYFAENRAVGEDYRISFAGKTDDNVGQLALQAMRQVGDDNPVEAAKYLRDRIKSEKADPHGGSGISINDMEKAAKKIEGGWKIPEANIYRVRIKANREHFLDWDKPLGEQNEYVKKALRNVVGSRHVDYPTDLTVEQIVRGDRDRKSEADVSKALKEAGIPGIKYLDQGSRDGRGNLPEEMITRQTDITSRMDEIAALSEEKRTPALYAEYVELQNKREELVKEMDKYLVEHETSNFVLFDEKLAEITHKNDIPVAKPTRARAEKQLELKLPEQYDVRDPFERGALIGVANFDKYMDLIRKRHEEDVAKATTRNEAFARRKLSRDWQDEETKTRSEVAQEIARRPEMQADEFVRTGVQGEYRVPGTYRLGEEFLTDEQRASLPTSHVTKSGIDPDTVAWRFGFSSGADMVNALADVHRRRTESGQNNIEWRRSLVRDETERVMEEKYAAEKASVLEQAKDQALSDTQLELLHEETLGMAIKAGVEYSLTKADIGAMVRERVNNWQMGDISSDRMLAAAGRAGRAEVTALLKEDWAGAFRARQQKEFATTWAKQALDLEQRREKFDALAKRFSKREVPNVAQDYTNAIHDMLMRVGERVNRSVQDLAESMKRDGFESLAEFASAKQAQTFDMLNIPVPDFLRDPNFRRPVDNLTMEQFTELHNSLIAMSKLGRDELKIIREGESADRAALIGQMVDALETFPVKERNATPTVVDRATALPRAFLAASTSMETLLNRFDRDDPRGVFKKWVMYPLAAAANRKAALIREFSKPYGELGKIEDQTKLITSPIIDPNTGKPLPNFTMGNVQTMVHNAGTRAQWEKFAKGWGSDPDSLMVWLMNNSTRAMWDRAQKMGDTIFQPAFEKAQTVYHNIYGYAPEKLELTPFENAFGRYEGWYHPLIKDPLQEVYFDQDGKRMSGQTAKQLGGSVYDNTDNFHARTANGYTKSRTNAVYPIDLNPDMIPVRLTQMLHDIAFRDPIIQAEKVLNDPKLRNAIYSHYGEFYRDGLKPYLQGLAGAEGIPSKAGALATKISEYLRQNTIATYIGFNPFTALKHGPTALVLSTKQVGILPFMEAMKDLYRSSDEINLSNKEFVDKWSEEVGRRSRHWQDTILGEHADIYGQGTMREKTIEAGSWLVAQSDMLSVRPTWLAAYRNAIREGSNHGEAIDFAEAAVRQAHGSTAATNQPRLVASGGPLHGWLTSIYGFFGTVMQRRIELAHAVNDAYQLGKEGDIASATKALPDIVSRTFAYVIWPTLVEEWVTGLTTEDKRGWGTHILTGALAGLGSSVLYLRDVTHSLLYGYDPGVGLASSPLHDLKNLVGDVKKGTKMFSKETAGKLVQDAVTVFGEFTGRAPKEVGSLLRAGIDLTTGQAKPKTAKDWRLLLTRGQTKPRQVK